MQVAATSYRYPPIVNLSQRFDLAGAPRQYRKSGISSGQFSSQFQDISIAMKYKST